jgi:hypothetical protein
VFLPGFSDKIMLQWLDLGSSIPVFIEQPSARDGMGFALVSGAGISGRLAIFGGKSGSASKIMLNSISTLCRSFSCLYHSVLFLYVKHYHQSNEINKFVYKSLAIITCQDYV